MYIKYYQVADINYPMSKIEYFIKIHEGEASSRTSAKYIKEK